MALKIRLRKQGRTNRSFFRFVVTDSRSPRDGKYVEALGWYNPIESENEKKLFILPDRVQYWLGLGAQMTENAQSLIALTAPELVRQQKQKEVAHRVKATAKRKAKKAAA